MVGYKAVAKILMGRSLGPSLGLPGSALCVIVSYRGQTGLVAVVRSSSCPIIVCFITGCCYSHSTSLVLEYRVGPTGSGSVCSFALL